MSTCGAAVAVYIVYLHLCDHVPLQIKGVTIKLNLSSCWTVHTRTGDCSGQVSAICSCVQCRGVHHTLLHIKITFDGRGLKKFSWDQLHISDRCSILALAAEQSYGLGGYFCLDTWAAFDWRRVGWWLTEVTIRRKTASCHNCYHDRHPQPPVITWLISGSSIAIAFQSTSRHCTDFAHANIICCDTPELPVS